MQYDILLSGGLVVNPEERTEEVRSIGIADGRIACVGAQDAALAKHRLDVSGCIVTPGLIDLHTHIWPFAHFGVRGEAFCFPNGVTAAADAGSVGCSAYEAMRPYLAASSLTTKLFLNVCSTGLGTLGSCPENIDPAAFRESEIQRLLASYPDEIAGLKIRISRDITGDMGMEPLRQAVGMARRLGTKLMAHCTNPPAPMSEILALLGADDIVTHAFHGQGETLLVRGIQAATAARERGVIFDLGAAGTQHFSEDQARLAIGSGFLPDTISTDATVNNMYIRGKAFSLPSLIGRLLDLGVPLGTVIAGATLQPARILGLDTGRITPGTQADIAVFRLSESRDSHMQKHVCLRPVLTIKSGRIVFRDIAI